MAVGVICITVSRERSNDLTPRIDSPRACLVAVVARDELIMYGVVRLGVFSFSELYFLFLAAFTGTCQQLSGRTRCRTRT